MEAELPDRGSDLEGVGDSSGQPGDVVGVVSAGGEAGGDRRRPVGVGFESGDGVGCCIEEVEKRERRFRRLLPVDDAQVGGIIDQDVRGSQVAVARDESTGLTLCGAAEVREIGAIGRSIGCQPRRRGQHEPLEVLVAEGAHSPRELSPACKPARQTLLEPAGGEAPTPQQLGRNLAADRRL